MTITFKISTVCVFFLSLSFVFVFKDTLSHDDAPPYQVWLQNVEKFKRYLPDKVQTHGHGDSNIYRPVELDNSCKKFNTTPSPPDKINIEKQPKPKITIIIAYKRSNVAIRKQNSKRLRQRMESGGKVGGGGGGAEVRGGASQWQQWQIAQIESRLHNTLLVNKDYK